jgi:hypothetical protein
VMATILSSSDTAPLKSVINCCTAVTTLSILSRGWLLTVGAQKPAFGGFLLWEDLLQELGVPEVAAAVLHCLGARPRRRHLVS